MEKKPGVERLPTEAERWTIASLAVLARLETTPSVTYRGMSGEQTRLVISLYSRQASLKREATTKWKEHESEHVRAVFSAASDPTMATLFRYRFASLPQAEGTSDNEVNEAIQCAQRLADIEAMLFSTQGDRSTYAIQQAGRLPRLDADWVSYTKRVFVGRAKRRQECLDRLDEFVMAPTLFHPVKRDDGRKVAAAATAATAKTTSAPLGFRFFGSDAPPVAKTAQELSNEIASVTTPDGRIPFQLTFEQQSMIQQVKRANDSDTVKVVQQYIQRDFLRRLNDDDERGTIPPPLKEKSKAFFEAIKWSDPPLVPSSPLPRDMESRMLIQRFWETDLNVGVAVRAQDMDPMPRYSWEYARRMAMAGDPAYKDLFVTLANGARTYDASWWGRSRTGKPPRNFDETEFNHQWLNPRTFLKSEADVRRRLDIASVAAYSESGLLYLDREKVDDLAFYVSLGLNQKIVDGKELDAAFFSPLRKRYRPGFVTQPGDYLNAAGRAFRVQRVESAKATLLNREIAPLQRQADHLSVQERADLKRYLAAVPILDANVSGIQQEEAETWAEPDQQIKKERLKLYYDRFYWAQLRPTQQRPTTVDSYFIRALSFLYRNFSVKGSGVRWGNVLLTAALVSAASVADAAARQMPADLFLLLLEPVARVTTPLVAILTLATLGLGIAGSLADAFRGLGRQLTKGLAVGLSVYAAITSREAWFSVSKGIRNVVELPDLEYKTPQDRLKDERRRMEEARTTTPSPLANTVATNFALYRSTVQALDDLFSKATKDDPFRLGVTSQERDAATKALRDMLRSPERNVTGLVPPHYVPAADATLTDVLTCLRAVWEDVKATEGGVVGRITVFEQTKAHDPRGQGDVTVTEVVKNPGIYYNETQRHQFGRLFITNATLTLLPWCARYNSALQPGLGLACDVVAQYGRLDANTSNPGPIDASFTQLVEGRSESVTRFYENVGLATGGKRGEPPGWANMTVDENAVLAAVLVHEAQRASPSTWTWPGIAAGNVAKRFELEEQNKRLALRGNPKADIDKLLRRDSDWELDHRILATGDLFTLFVAGIFAPDKAQQIIGKNVVTLKEMTLSEFHARRPSDPSNPWTTLGQWLWRSGNETTTAAPPREGEESKAPETVAQWISNLLTTGSGSTLDLRKMRQELISISSPSVVMLQASMTVGANVTYLLDKSAALAAYYHGKVRQCS
jgi:hypothetical protein